MVGNSCSLTCAIEALEGSALREEKEKRMFSHHSTTNVWMLLFFFLE